MDLVEDNRRITPRDYLELALRPVQGSGKDIAAKNEVLSNSNFPVLKLEAILTFFHFKNFRCQVICVFFRSCSIYAYVSYFFK